MDKNAIAVAVFDKLAGRYDELYGDVSAYARSLLFFCERLKPGAELLELACGPGNTTRFLLQHRPDFKILATDLSARMLQIAQNNNPTVRFEQLDCRQLLSQKRPDGILASFVLPYLDASEARQLIADAAQLLLPGGLLYLSTIEGLYENSAWETSSTGEKVFMHYHNGRDLKQTLMGCGLEIVHEDRVHTTDARGRSNTDLMLIASKKPMQHDGL